jgi:hypothetical protein
LLMLLWLEVVVAVEAIEVAAEALEESGKVM